MLLDHHRVVRDVTTRLPDATTPLDACRATVSVLGRHAPARVSVLLWSHDRLRRVAGTDRWQGHDVDAATTGPSDAVISRVYTSGKTETVTGAEIGGATTTSARDDHRPFAGTGAGTGGVDRVCAPIPALDGRPIGVLDVESTGPLDLDSWRDTAERVAGRLGIRIVQLGGVPGETRDERLLRHTRTIWNASNERELTRAALAAVRDISGLSVVLLALTGPAGTELVPPATVPGSLEARLRALLTGGSGSALAGLVAWVRRRGATYTTGTPNRQPPDDAGPLPAEEVGTLVAVPVGPAEDGGVLLLADERPLAPDPVTVNLVRMLAAQAWSCRDRLRELARLREQASSDPLTGLGHHGQFDERIAGAVPGRTALIAIDVDGFKNVNDRYGHQAGDRVLVNLARALEAALRQGDELYRIGGDEFVAVVEVNRLEEAAGIAERLIEAARGTGGTISAGVAVQRPGEPPELTLGRADAALYEVKRDGRDGVRLSGD